jgi:hypothetical protein
MSKVECNKSLSANHGEYTEGDEADSINQDGGRLKRAGMPGLAQRGEVGSKLSNGGK